MMSLGIILVHGYSGSNRDFYPLLGELMAPFGKDSVINLSLPGHDLGEIPAFDENLFIKTIHNAINNFQKENRKIILIGHSTGGSLALATIFQYSIIPEQLILISVPKKIDFGYFERWDRHRAGKEKILLSDVALMVKFINTTGAKQLTADFPVLIIHGEADRLVLCEESQHWKKENFSESTRVVTIPKVDHAIFNGSNSHLVIDLIQRAISDIASQDRKDPKIIQSLIEVEPEFRDFFKATPFSESHLSVCPSAQCVIDKKPQLLPTAVNDPVIANIEITTYCNLKCKFCARSQLKKFNKHMSFDQFSNILAILPNTYKVVIVGLGEPLVHPQLVEFIQYAKSLRKKVSLVTNATLLKPEISKRLLEAGLDSIAFSIDGADNDLATLVRKGTDLNRVLQNIHEFIQIADSTRKVSKAVFSAVSVDTVYKLKDLIDRVAELGVDVMMLSDINFKANLEHTLWQNRNDQIEETVRKAISYAFTKNLPVLSVHGLEEFGLEKRYQDFLMIPPAQLYQRSSIQSWCYSPWQTIPVDVEGNVTLCDCQPEFVIGNLFQDAFSKIWNGEAYQKYRTEMLSQRPPEACRICPRF